MDYTIDVKNKRLGRVATEIATILQGKHKASYDPRLPGDDRVIVKNVAQLQVTGNKESQKMYYRPSTRLGAMKTDTFEKKFNEDPAWVLRHAVRLMLPKNRLRDRRLKRLVIEQ